MASKEIANRVKTSLGSVSLLARQSPYNPVNTIFAGATLSGWYAARNLSSTSGAAVPLWPDKSGFGAGRDLTANVPDGLPPKFSSFTAGMPAVEFYSVIDAASGSSFSSAKLISGAGDAYLIQDGYSLYIVCSATNVIKTWDIPTQLGQFILVNGGTRTWYVGFGTVAAAKKVGVRFDNAGGVGTGLVTPYVEGTPILIEIITRAGNLIFNVNGVEQTVALSPKDFPNVLQMVGAAGALICDCKIAELITYRGALADPDRIILKNALKAQYGLP